MLSFVYNAECTQPAHHSREGGGGATLLQDTSFFRFDQLSAFPLGDGGEGSYMLIRVAGAGFVICNGKRKESFDCGKHLGTRVVAI